MSQYEKILLITQPDMQESAALTRATALAYKSGAVLHLCLIDYSTTLAGLRQIATCWLSSPQAFRPTCSSGLIPR
jgi:hypothetical protein